MHLVPRLGLALIVAGSVVIAAPQRPDAPAATSPAITATAAHLTGRIVAASDGTALRQARVAISVGGRVHATDFTDSDGRFDIETPGAVAYAVTVTKSGYLTARVPRPARPGRGTLELSLARMAIIYGRVVDPGGHPVVSIRVQVQRVDAGQASTTAVMTDDLGAYRVAELPPGHYAITTIGVPEYAPSPADQTRSIDANYQPAAPRVGEPPVTSSERVDVDVGIGSSLDVTLDYRNPAVVLAYANVGSVVSGQIIDEAGEPAVGLTVQLWRMEFENGAPIAARSVAPRTTDDRGQFRMFHIKAGRYVLIVTDDASQTANRASSWLPVYYPGTTSPTGATILTVGRSLDLSGHDMVFTHSAGARVFGRAVNSAGQPLQNILSLVPSNRDLPVSPQTVSIDADGGFEFERVPAGEYVVRASAWTSGRSDASGGANPEFGLQRVRVGDGDVGPLAFQTAESATLRGHIVFEGMEPLDTNFEVSGATTDPLYTLGLLAGEMRISTGTVDARTWTFELPRLAGPIRLTLAAVPPEVWLKSAYVGDVNAVETPVLLLGAKDSRDDITLVVAGTAATITGRTITSTGRPAAGAQVVAFSTNRERWFSMSPFVKSIYSDEQSEFELESLPPGEDRVVAFDSNESELDRSDADRMEFLDSLTAGARRVTLGEGQVLSFNPRTVMITR